MKKSKKSLNLQNMSSDELEPSGPEHGIVRMSEISRSSLGFVDSFPDGSPFFTWVEFSVTDLCNRTCVFCPRFDPKMYPDNNEEISLDLYEKIMNDLAESCWQGGIVFSAFGEPLLHRNLVGLVALTKRYLPDSNLDIVTNGDKLTAEKCLELYSAGLDTLKVSLYDGPEQIPIFEELRRQIGIAEKRFVLRHRYDAEKNYGLIMSNRGGSVTSPDITLRDVELPLKHKCFFPFYMLVIDYDGRVLLCSHDWKKSFIVGDLKKQTIQEVWTGERMNVIREKLRNKDRNFAPCISCDVYGTLSGDKEFSRYNNLLSGNKNN